MDLTIPLCAYAIGGSQTRKAGGILNGAPARALTLYALPEVSALGPRSTPSEARKNGPIGLYPRPF